MATVAILEAYLALERMMMSLDAESDPVADRLRDLMDPLWHELGEDDRDFLNKRSPESLGAYSVMRCGAYMDIASNKLDAMTGGEYGDGELTLPLDQVLAA